jgi:hypothetical protein
LCEPWKERIEAALAAGLSVQRIYQDLEAEQSFAGSYYSVLRFARRLGSKRELPFRRLEVEPDQELQMDFGPGVWALARVTGIKVDNVARKATVAKSGQRLNFPLRKAIPPKAATTIIDINAVEPPSGTGGGGGTACKFPVKPK